MGAAGDGREHAHPEVGGRPRPGPAPAPAIPGGPGHGRPAHHGAETSRERRHDAPHGCRGGASSGWWPLEEPAGSQARAAADGQEAARRPAGSSGETAAGWHAVPRQERLQRHPVPPGRNSLHYWRQAKSLPRVAWNFFVISLCRVLPWFGVKNFLYRRLGMKVGRDVAFGLMAMVDIFWPELIQVGDNSIIGYNTVLLAHEFLIDEYRTGPVVIGRNVMIGANCTVLPGVVIGDGAVVSAHSLVNADVPPGAVVGGVPARPLGRRP
ncbi:hypothetical protein Tmar_0270 [Thermaerobacter marianensis DSM 12885]|uniref:Acyltransferase n=2 Tax=Thermaerobacter marianensis TaxID=73919 RepID=E6SM65_THEM7|nr:hypothetical protein Tmar_0270 [Thermaerobacter marianensis DSM 12885]